MRNRLMAGISVAVLLFGAAACGGKDSDDKGLSKDEKKAASSMAEQMVTKDTSKGGREQAACITNALVGKVGVKALQEAGLLSDDLTAVKNPGDPVSRSVASATADAVVKCVDFEVQAEETEDYYPDATAEDTDKFIKCMEDIDDGLMRDAIIESSVENGDQAKGAKYADAANECSKLRGTPVAPK